MTEINYHPLAYSGCSVKFASTMERKRDFKDKVYYDLKASSVLAAFKIPYTDIAGNKYNIINLSYKTEHITINSDIDYQSFTSLN
jgi:hypothetical protein